MVVKVVVWSSSLLIVSLGKLAQAFNVYLNNRENTCSNIYCQEYIRDLLCTLDVTMQIL